MSSKQRRCLFGVQFCCLHPSRIISADLENMFVRLMNVNKRLLAKAACPAKQAWFFFESKHFIYSVRNVHNRETEQHYLNIVI